MNLKYLKLYLCAAILSAIGSGCTVHKSPVRPTPKEVAEHAALYDLLPEKRIKIVEEASTWLGTPYKYAMQNKGEGTDCSGLVMQVFNSALNCKLPRNSARQADFCRKIKRVETSAGDLVFFATGTNPDSVSHVGIVVDDDNFIHASTSKGVIISKLSNPWYSKRLLMFGRVPLLDD